MTPPPWRRAEPSADDVAALAAQGPLPPLAAELLCAFVPEPSRREVFLASGPPEFPGPPAFPALAPAAERLVRALAGSERILVHGDYDVDGLMGAAVLAGGLRALGGKVSAFIPSRFEGGYGLSEASLRAVRDEGATLVVTVDCGTNARDVGEALAALGVDLIVADHHAPDPGRQPPGLLVNPHLGGADPELRSLCGAGVAYLLVRAVSEVLGRALPPEPFLRLLAIATVADVVPQSGLNRRLCKAGFRALEETPNPGLALLLSRCPTEGGVGSRHVGFYLAPRFNAAGRIEDARLVLELLLERDPAAAARMVGRLEALNETRKVLQAEALEGASRALSGQEGLPVAFAASSGWHRGVVGPVASRLAERARKSAFVAAVEGDFATGSGRGWGGDNVTERLRAASDLLERFGGHQGAAGFTVRAGRLSALESRLQSAASAAGAPARLRAYFPLPVSRLDDAWRALNFLDPLGPGVTEPQFGLADLKVRQRRVMKERHLAWDVEGPEGRALRLLAWDGVASGWNGESIGPGKLVVGRILSELRRGGAPYYIEVTDIL